MNPDFSVRLKQLRKDKNFTQAQVAKRIGLSRGMISGYETQMRYPGNDILAKLSKLFGVSSDYFLCIDDRKQIDVTDLTEREIAAVQEMVDVIRASKRKQHEYSSMREVI